MPKRGARKPRDVRGNQVAPVEGDNEAQLDPENLLFQAVKKRRFGASTCFLCGRRLGSRNRTDEHVIPQWVLDRFELRYARLLLLNGTAIPYRQLTIPCCAACNGVHLSQIENRVRSAVASGYRAVSRLST